MSFVGFPHFKQIRSSVGTAFFPESEMLPHALVENRVEPSRRWNQIILTAFRAADQVVFE